MDTFILAVRRQPGIVGATASTKVIVDGLQQASIRTGGVHKFTLPRKPVNVILLIQVPLGKDIAKTVLIDPHDSIEVTLIFTYKLNAKALLPFYVFTQQQFNVDTEIIYGPTISSQQHDTSTQVHAQFMASTSQHQDEGESDNKVKFCTECGTANPKEAKFCQNCGNKF